MSSTPTVGTTIRTDIGRTFRVTPNTFALDLAEVPDASNRGWLLVNQNRAVLAFADGTAFEPAAAVAVELIQRANVARVEAKLPPHTVPVRLRTASRYGPPQPPLPWPLVETQGFPGKDGEVLHVHPKTGRAVLVRDTTPANRTPTQASREARTYEVVKLSPRAAVAWMKEHGYRFIPATLHRLNRTGAGSEGIPGPGDPAPIP